ncbi:hypothetical protein Pan241w_11060 [Gimesia alba]|uniref:Uncharacterized protein n=1 Tax=Gimesia alba TaxID=2527973 RepID=A0A517RAY9_9PLAN|nr:hypothetical protein [Gimesia alba]QDT41047.1 hypothetical protein Pan241w_11060 [Gimesia alba]
MSSSVTVNQWCVICGTKIKTGDAVSINTATGDVAHTQCVGDPSMYADHDDSNRKTEQKSSPDADQLVPAPAAVSRDAIKQVVIEVLSECFSSVDFSFLDQKIDERIEQRLTK